MTFKFFSGSFDIMGKECDFILNSIKYSQIISNYQFFLLFKLILWAFISYL